MTRSERHKVYEAIAMGLSGLGLALTVPTLISQHDSVALFAAGFLVLAWAGWLAFFIYRLEEKSKGK